MNVVAAAVAAFLLAGCGSDQGEPGGSGVGAPGQSTDGTTEPADGATEPRDTSPEKVEARFREIVAGLERGEHPELARAINAALGLPPADTCCGPANIFLPELGSTVAGARFSAVDYSRPNPGRNMSIAVLSESSAPNEAGLTRRHSVAVLAPFRNAGIAPRRHPDIPGHLLYYDPNGQPGASNPGHLVVIPEDPPTEFIFLAIVLTEFGHDASQHREVQGGFQLAAEVAKELLPLLG